MFVESAGAKVRYEVYGDGTPVVLIGGLWTDVHYWKRLIGLLQGCRVVAFDIRGCGETEYRGRFTIGDLARDAFSVMDAAGFGSAHVLGWSMGSLVVQRMMSEGPERFRSAILLSTYPRRPALSRYLIMGMLDKVDAGESDLESLAMAINSMALTEEYFQRMEDKGIIPRMSMVKTSPSGLRHQMESVDGYSLDDSLCDNRIPTLVVHGDRDMMVPFKMGKDVADIVPESEFVAVPGAGHNILPEGYVSRMLEFIYEKEFINNQ